MISPSSNHAGLNCLGPVDGARFRHGGKRAIPLGARKRGAGGSAMFFGQDEPRLPAGEPARVDGRAPGRIVVDAVGKGIVKGAQFGVRVRVVAAGAVKAAKEKQGERGGRQAEAPAPPMQSFSSCQKLSSACAYISPKTTLAPVLR